MKTTYIVEYQGKDAQASISLPGPLLITIKSLVTKQNRTNHVILTDSNVKRNKEDDMPDVLVGSIPLIHLSDDGVTPAITYLKIPPPAPFDKGDVELMWEKVRSTGCPIPRSVALQGRYVPGSPTAINPKQITAEFLNYAHQQCRHLLSRWPTVESQELVQRNVELQGGREDFLLTERNIGSTPLLDTQENRRIPQRTFRRRSSDIIWKSYLLSNAASTLVKNIRTRSTALIPSVEVENFIAPFTAVAKLAGTRQSFVDPPVSTWPSSARLCYEGLLAAMAVLKVDDQGEIPAPLSYLWRLYEVWISAICLEVTVQRFGGLSVENGLLNNIGCCEWMTSWHFSDEKKVILMAQPSIQAEPLMDTLPIQSTTCDLKPDILLAFLWKNNIQILVVDAKKRSSRTAMDSFEVATAGSKYAWGIRSSLYPDINIVDPVLVVSNSPLGRMHASRSNIRSIQGAPSYSDELSKTINRELDIILSRLEK